ncbi:two component transcriptional regulator, LuxR family [Nitrosospira sp. Nsp14]|uniref:response regulator transcription factor n=1 Tax=Nitrosospira sp. Nsp14 TaxID=1855333 RepID=UPI0008EA03D2|nr:response regulator transcription factor [Nitrosospira sp. Nsp14]SFH48131.1 two component transcriptional regulator, LuxR family [Nitrosospira sp. Nsp14]
MRASKAQVMLVDDHPLMRHGMAMLINLESDMEVSAEAGDGEEALATLKAGPHPDVVLMDLSLKTVSGFEVIKSMHSLIPALPVLVVSMFDEGIYAERALRAGARGYVMKLEPGRVLVGAIRKVLKGNFSLSNNIQARLLNRVVTGNSESELISKLSPSEFEVLHLIGTGHSSRQIADLLNRSIKTIETHRYNVRTKLNLKDAADLIRYATRWITEEH